MIVGNLKANLKNTRSVFDDIVSSPAQSGGIDTGFVQLSWSRMAVQNQGMVFDAGRLSHLLRDQADELRQARKLLIFALMGAFVAFLLTSYLLFSRRTLKSIADLQEGARIIGSGNLDYTIDEKGDDEISELSRSFNLMTSDLKHVIASKADLEREIAGRKQAEEELQQLLVQLEDRTHQLEATAANLQAANEELEITNEEMEIANEELQAITDELVRQSRELEEAHREANLYLDIMTHDIRNANNVSSMYADLLADLAEGDPKTYAEKLHDSIDRSSEILRNVATIRRVQSESARRVPVDLDAVIREELGTSPGASIQYDGRRIEVLADGLLPGIFTNLSATPSSSAVRMLRLPSGSRIRTPGCW